MLYLLMNRATIGMFTSFGVTHSCHCQQEIFLTMIFFNETHNMITFPALMGCLFVYIDICACEHLSLVESLYISHNICKHYSHLGKLTNRKVIGLHKCTHYLAVLSPVSLYIWGNILSC